MEKTSAPKPAQYAENVANELGWTYAGKLKSGHRRFEWTDPRGNLHVVTTGSGAHSDRDGRIDAQKVRSRIRQCMAGDCNHLDKTEGAKEEAPEGPPVFFRPGDQVLVAGQPASVIEEDGEHAVVVNHMTGEQDIVPVSELAKAASFDPLDWQHLRVSMAERSGHPDLDRVIQEFLKKDFLYDGNLVAVQSLCDPALSEGKCDLMSDAFVEFANNEGLDAHVDFGTWDPVENTDDPESYNHEVAIVDIGPYQYSIDFTAAQFQDLEPSPLDFPLVRRRRKRVLGEGYQPSRPWSIEWNEGGDLIKEAGREFDPSNLSMIFLEVPEVDLEVPEDAHLTLFSFEDLTDEEKEALKEIVRSVSFGGVSGQAEACALYGPDDDILVVEVEGKDILRLYEEIKPMIEEAGIGYKDDYDFSPHITIERDFQGELPDIEEVPLDFRALAVAHGDCSDEDNISFRKTATSKSV